VSTGARVVLDVPPVRRPGPPLLGDEARRMSTIEQWYISHIECPCHLTGPLTVLGGRRRQFPARRHKATLEVELLPQRLERGCQLRISARQQDAGAGHEQRRIREVHPRRHQAEPKQHECDAPRRAHPGVAKPTGGEDAFIRRLGGGAAVSPRVRDPRSCCPSIRWGELREALPVRSMTWKHSLAAELRRIQLQPAGLEVRIWPQGGIPWPRRSACCAARPYATQSTSALTEAPSAAASRLPKVSSSCGVAALEQRNKRLRVRLRHS
jgi:hypothetical protein